jgi:hypothetical protein
MKYRRRTYYTEEQKAVMWDRWQQGDSLHAIARLFDLSLPENHLKTRFRPPSAGVDDGGLRRAGVR